MSKEEFRPIFGRYKIGSNGTVLKGGKAIKPTITSRGYRVVSLQISLGRRSTFTIEQLCRIAGFNTGNAVLPTISSER